MATRGRPREFSLDDALDRAIPVFWQHGYGGASLDELTTAMGINRPSMYSAFGDKEHLFRSALERYAAVDMAYVGEATHEPTAKAVAEHYLRSNVIAITTPGKPAGCLSIQAATALGVADASVVEFIASSRTAGQARLAERFREAKDEGDLGRDDDPEELALYLTTISSGLAVRAADGEERERLSRTAERALSAFPGNAAITS